jgi:hypothetical protein
MSENVTTEAGPESNGISDVIDNLTGLQVKRVQSLTGSPIHQPADYYELIFALAYVSPMHPAVVKNWGKDEIDGFAEFQANTTTKAAAEMLEGDGDSDPKDAPAN